MVIEVLAAKAEREEAIVESVVEGVVKMAVTPRKVIGTDAQALNTCCHHRGPMHRVAHGDSMHSSIALSVLLCRGRQMRRREFITLFGVAAATWPSLARAQRLADKSVRIGLLQPSLENPVGARGYPAFLDELKKSGFSEGHNLTVQIVRLDQDSQSLFAETAELLRTKVDLVVTAGSETALQAILAGSRTIPVVIWAINYDPIALGYVNSLARPGGNITGIVSLQTELAAKQVELLTQAFPGRTRLGIFWDQISGDQFAAAEHQARSLGLNVQPLKLEHTPMISTRRSRNLTGAHPRCCLCSQALFSGPPARASLNSRSSNVCRRCSSLRPMSKRAA